MQGRLRRFLTEYNRRTGATVILTSHYNVLSTEAAGKVEPRLLVYLAV